MTSTNPNKADINDFNKQSCIYKSLPIRLNRKTNSPENNIKIAAKGGPSLKDLSKMTTPTAVSAMSAEANDEIACWDMGNTSQRTCSPTGNELPRHINDCLQDLDDYLEQMDSGGGGTPKRISGEELNSRNFLPGLLNTATGLSDTNETENIGNELETGNENQLASPSNSAEYFESPKSRHAWNDIDLHINLENISDSFETSNHHNESANQTLTSEQIFNNFLTECSQESENRPRQLGRRATGQPTVLSARTTMIEENSTPNSSVVNRPFSAPPLNTYDSRTEPPLRNVESQFSPTSNLISEASSLRTSHNPSPISSVYATTDSSSISTVSNLNADTSVTLNVTEQQQAGSTQPATPTVKSSTQWPHFLSQSFALTSCTLGLFNLSRFSVLVLNYGGNFVLQFLLLSFLFGIPLLWLQMCLGARIKNGPVTMWRISPISKGIGIALIIVQFVISVYSSVCIAWILIYIKDSLPTSNQFVTNAFRMGENQQQTAQNYSSEFANEVGQYFSVQVLQRLVGEHLSFRINERLSFYLAFLWTSVLLVLCRGLRSYGNFVYLLSPIPLIALAVIVTKLLFVVDCSRLRNIFSAVYLEDFLINPHAWTAAAQETFLTWGLLGPSVIAMTSKTHAGVNKKSLRYNALYVVLVTFFGLFLAAILGLCAEQILESSNFVYIPGSYESPETSKSIYFKPKLEPDMISFPPQLVPHYSSFVGETYRRSYAVAHQKSGYQALRFISELFPAMAVLSKTSFTWGWGLALLVVLLAFGLAQLCAMWKPISSALGNSTNAVLLSCVTGLLLSIPFATEIGIHILHFADTIFGASWIVPILWTTLIFGIFLIRGRPYNGDELVDDLKMSTSISAFLALAWNVLLPIGLLFLAVIEYKISNSNQFFHWRGRAYFSYWERKVAGSIQVFVLLLVPIIGIIQIFRYLNNGSADIFERIHSLYRPMDESERLQRLMNVQTFTIRRAPSIDDIDPSSVPPPKYTPPPSYTTATGARMAKLLRQSIRRSVRRIRAVAESARPWSFESENELIVSNMSNAEISNNLNAVRNAEESFTQQNANIQSTPRRVSSPTRSLGYAMRPNQTDRRSNSLPRRLQRVTLANFPTTDIVDGFPEPPLTSNITDELVASRSVDNLATNAEPPDQSQPPINIIIRTKSRQQF